MPDIANVVLCILYVCECVRERGHTQAVRKLANGLALIFVMACILLMASLSHIHIGCVCTADSAKLVRLSD